MKTIHSFNVYSFFVLGLLIGAFGVFFFMSASNQDIVGDEQDSGSEFNTQSYEETTYLPQNGFITGGEVFDQHCVNTNCAADCEALGKSTNECRNVCYDSGCQKFVVDVKKGSVVVNFHDAAEEKTLAPSFNLGAQKRTASEIVINDEINQKKPTSGNLSTQGYDYYINKKRYNEECQQYECVDYCLGVKGDTALEYCEKNCVSNSCLGVKGRDTMEMHKVTNK